MVGKGGADSLHSTLAMDAAAAANAAYNTTFVDALVPCLLRAQLSNMAALIFRTSSVLL